MKITHSLDRKFDIHIISVIVITQQIPSNLEIWKAGLVLFLNTHCSQMEENEKIPVFSISKCIKQRAVKITNCHIWINYRQEKGMVSEVLFSVQKLQIQGKWEPQDGCNPWYAGRQSHRVSNIDINLHHTGDPYSERAFKSASYIGSPSGTLWSFKCAINSCRGIEL